MKFHYTTEHHNACGTVVNDQQCHALTVHDAQGRLLTIQMDDDGDIVLTIGGIGMVSLEAVIDAVGRHATP